MGLKKSAEIKANPKPIFLFLPARPTRRARPKYSIKIIASITMLFGGIAINDQLIQPAFSRWL